MMLPWMFAYDRTNYAKYAPIYWLEMMQLAETHPWIHNQLVTNPGSWTTQHQNQSGFCSMSSDQTIETTINKDSKTSGGIRGITLSKGAVQRWIFSQPAKAAIASVTEEMAGISSAYRVHKECDAPRMKRDEATIVRLQDTITAMINPWNDDHPDAIVSLGSGVVASPQAQVDLERAYDLGSEQTLAFIDSRIKTMSEPFHSTIKQNRLKTFAVVKKKSNSTEKVLKLDRATFAPLVVVAQTREIDMKTVLSYPLSPVSAALASCDGMSISKTNKASLLTLLEDKCQTVAHCDLSTLEDSAVIFDAMACIQAFPRSKIPNTFGEFAEHLFQSILLTAKAFSATRIDFVGDQYRAVSIKNTERQRRGMECGNERTIYSASQPTPKLWSKFLATPANKQSLQSFVVKHWAGLKTDTDIRVYVAVERKCEVLRYESSKTPSSEVVPELETDQEEADTRMLLHASHANANNSRYIIIKSPDTDVALLALHFAPTFKESMLFFATGTGNKKRVLSVTEMSAHLGGQITKALPGIHAFSGCDTVSSFHGKGKKSCYTHGCEDEYAHEFFKLGNSFSLNEETFQCLQRYVCALYKVKCDNVNDARYKMFCSTAPEERCLPPTEDCLRQHASRAAYQARVWHLATTPMTSCPPPQNHGWHMEAGELRVTWMNGQHAPPEVLKVIFCGCKGICSDNKCSCVKAKLPCTDLCRCGMGCKNKVAAESEDEIYSDSDEDI